MGKQGMGNREWEIGNGKWEWEWEIEVKSLGG